MTRDMDLIRELLLEVEENPAYDGTIWITFDPSRAMQSGHSLEEVIYHIRLLDEAGFIRVTYGAIYPSIAKLTWKGHEFLDDIKDQVIWAKTKERVSGLPGVALEVVAEIAKAEIKRRLGLP